MMAEQYEQKYL